MIVISRIDDRDKTEIERFIDESEYVDAIIRNKIMFESLICKQTNDNFELDVLQFIEWRKK
jgi:hypothetical protein